MGDPGNDSKSHEPLQGNLNTKAENSNICFVQYHKILILCSSRVYFSLEIQMSKRPLVVKTYGRHKNRTVKAQSWLSPDETFLSPFGDQSRRLLEYFRSPRSQGGKKYYV